MFTVPRLLRVSILSFTAALVVAACGGGDESKPETPTDVCDRVATAECNKLYACTTEAIRQQFGLVGPPANCIIGLAAQVQCQNATAQKICAGANPYTAAQAEACIAEANAATCDKVIANTTNVTAYAPSCGQCVPTLM
jgi:hypothetical protein